MDDHSWWAISRICDCLIGRIFILMSMGVDFKGRIHVIPNPDPTPGSAGFQPALGYTELFAGKIPALPA